MDSNEYKEQKEQVKQSAIWLSMMPQSLQVEFFRFLFRNVEDKDKIRLFDKIANFVYPQFQWIKIENWMEKRFIKDMARTPRQVASMFLMYSKTSTKMAPKMIVLAQKVKDRLRKRIEREISNHSHKKNNPND
jgi:hypothetical protein